MKLSKIKILSILLLLVLVFTGCKTTQNIQYVHDTLKVTNIEYQFKHDSIWKDRVHTEYIKGDTLVIKDSIYIYKYKSISDTIYKDSIIYKDRLDTKTIVKNKYPVYPYIIFILFCGACYIYFKYIRKRLLS